MMEEIGCGGLVFFQEPKTECRSTLCSHHEYFPRRTIFRVFHIYLFYFSDLPCTTSISSSHVGNHPPSPAIAGTSGPIHPTLVYCPPYLLEDRDRCHWHPCFHHWLERFSAACTCYIGGPLALSLCPMDFQADHKLSDALCRPSQCLPRRKDLPPVVFHYIPWFGSAAYYGEDPYKFLFECRDKYGDLFTFILMGRRITVALGPKGNNLSLGGKISQVSAEEAYTVSLYASLAQDGLLIYAW